MNVQMYSVFLWITPVSLSWNKSFELWYQHWQQRLCFLVRIQLKFWAGRSLQIYEWTRSSATTTSAAQHLPNIAGLDAPAQAGGSFEKLRSKEEEKESRQQSARYLYSWDKTTYWYYSNRWSFPSRPSRAIVCPKWRVLSD